MLMTKELHTTRPAQIGLHETAARATTKLPVRLNNSSKKKSNKPKQAESVDPAGRDRSGLHALDAGGRDAVIAVPRNGGRIPAAVRHAMPLPLIAKCSHCPRDFRWTTAIPRPYIHPTVLND